MQSSEHRSEKHVSVAASEKCYLISTGPSTFVLHIQLCCNKIFIFSKILFHWYGTYLICSFHYEAQVDLGH